jgi:3-methyladenine DNA glycosylase AlkD
MRVEDVIRRLRSMANPENVRGMARFGISPDGTLGVPMPELRRMGKEIGRDHRLAGLLWESRIHEARILAAIIDEPAKVTKAQMDSWARDFDSWDVCDGVCCNLFDRTPYAREKAGEWSRDGGEYVKRAGFVLMAALAVHDKKAGDGMFEEFLQHVREAATDERNFVRKAVNWALRQIGKRNMNLNRKALSVAREVSAMDSKAARWIASDAIRELTDERTLARIKPGKTG